MRKAVFTFFVLMASSLTVLAIHREVPVIGPALDASADGLVFTTFAPFATTGGITESGYRLTYHKREQLLANLEQIAVLNQAYTVQFNELVKSARVSLAQEVGADKVAQMTDQEVIAAFIK